jgi:hypothetical protein
MKLAYALATGACLGALLATAPAQASVVTPLDVTSGSGLLTGSASFSASGSFIEDLTFTLASAITSGSSGAISSYIKLSQEISNLTLSLYSGSPTGTNTLVATSASSSTTPFTTSSGIQTVGLSFSGLAAGNYYLAISGTVSSLTSLGVTATISPVPIPAALPLFGMAVAGFAAVRRRRRNKNGADLLQGASQVS